MKNAMKQFTAMMLALTLVFGLLPPSAAADTDTPISRGKPVAFSSEQVDATTFNYAKNVVDGNSSTRWAAATSSFPQWIKIDLGAVHNISAYHLLFYNPTSRSYGYNIWVSDSDDGADEWRDNKDTGAYTKVIDNTGNRARDAAGITHNIGGEGHTARYIVIDVVSSDGGGNASIFVADVFGWRLESDVYTVDETAKAISNVGFETAGEFMENIAVAGNATAAVVDGSGNPVADTTRLAKGHKLQVTATRGGSSALYDIRFFAPFSSEAYLIDADNTLIQLLGRDDLTIAAFLENIVYDDSLYALRFYEGEAEILDKQTILTEAVTLKVFDKDPGVFWIEYTFKVAKVLVTGVTLNKESIELMVGGTDTLVATIAPEDASIKAISWESSAPAIISVDNGRVTALAVGTATITATSVDDRTKFASCVVAADPTVKNYPVLSGLAVNDAGNAGHWSVAENLMPGDTVYGDSDAVFAAVPQSLQGSAWVRPAAASAAWSGADSLCEFAVNFSGYLYIALSDGIATVPGWMAGYEKTAETITAGAETYQLYRKYVYAGTTAELGAQNGGGNPMYIPILKTMTVSGPPNVPTVSRFAAPYHRDGWYYVRQNLDVGSELYTYIKEIGKTGASNSRVVTALPERFKGSEYLQTYTTATNSLSFFLERDTEVSVTVDIRRTTLPSWLQSSAWTDTGETMEAIGNTGTTYTYRIYSRIFPAGLVTLAGMSAPGDNYIVIYRPANADAEKAANPLVAEGTDGYTPSRSYQYYASDVFNAVQAVSDYAGYAVISGNAEIVSDAVDEPVGEEPELLDFVFGRPVSSSGDLSGTYSKDNVANANNDAYWESNGLPAWIAIEFDGPKTADTIVLKVRSTWGDRTQTLSIEGSMDGTNYTEIVASKTYNFIRNSGNTVTILLDEPTTMAHLRLNITAVSDGGRRAQLSSIQAFGQEFKSAPVSLANYVELRGDHGAALERRFDGPVNARALYEFKLRSSQSNQPMSAFLTASDGSTLVGFRFAADGYLKATDGDGSVNLLPYQPDTWYTVKLVTDLTLGTYDVWVNHLRVAEGLAAPAGKAADALTFAVEQDGSLFIDNVYVYDDTEVYGMRETFNGLEAGALPGAGWRFTSPAEVSVADVPFASDRSLMVASEIGQNTAVRELTPMSGLLTFETKVKPVGTEFVYMPVLTDDEHRVAAAVVFYRNNFFACDGDNWVTILDGELPWSYYPANNWYKIRITLNTDTNRYDLYIDGALRRSGLSFAEDVDEISRAVYTVSEGNTAYIKQLDLYEGKNFGRGMYPNDIVFNVKEAPYNAVGDGIADDTAAVQKALNDAAYTGGTVLLTDGVFLTAMIQVKDDTTLFIDDTARLLGIPDRTRFPEKVVCNGRVNSAQVGKGFIYTERASNVRIEGGGIVDGNGFYGYDENDPSGANRRPTIMLLALSYDVTVQNLDLVNSCFWTLVPMESTNMTIRNINISSGTAPNRDGIDPTDLINGTIENCDILAADDALCFKSSAVYGVRNIDVRNMTLQSTIASGIKFGTDSYDALENISMVDITIKNVMHSGIAIESVDGAPVDTLHFERIDMSDVANSLFFVVGNRQREPSRGSLGKRVGYIRNLTFKDINFSYHKTAPYIQNNTNPEVLFLGLNTTNRIQNIVMENVNLNLPGGMTTVPNWPTGSGSGYPEQNSIGGRSNAWAYCLRWCDNVTFINCTNTLLAPDARPEVAYHDSYVDTPIVHDRPIRHVMPVQGLTVAIGADAQTLLPATAAVVIDYNKVADVPVIWTCPDYDANTPGEYAFVGSIASGTVDGTDRVTNPGNLTAAATVTVTAQTEAKAKADIRSDATADIDVPVEYIVSMENMKNVLNVRFRFEVDGDYLSSQGGLEVLNAAFETVDGGEGAIRWTPKEDNVWEGDVLLVYLGSEEGFTSAEAVDLFKAIFNAKQIGDATMKLTGLLVVGIDENDDVVFLDSEIGMDEATTAIKLPDPVYSIYDLNKDGFIDERDLAMAQRYYMVKEGDAGWAAAQVCDFRADGVIDMLDLIELYLHFT